MKVAARQMVSDDAFRARADGGRRVDAADFVELCEDRRENFGFVAARLALQDRGHAFEAHAGIDVLLRQRLEFAVGRLVILHENVVPDFDPALVARIERFRGGQRPGPVKHLGIRAAGTGGAGRAPPVVLLAEFRDAGRRDAVRAPFVVGLFVERTVFVTGEHGHGEHVGRNVQVLFSGQEFKAETDHLLLEIVAERPVAEHFEEGQVHRVADLVDVAGCGCISGNRSAACRTDASPRADTAPADAFRPW